jgi:hypothetical protein
MRTKCQLCYDKILNDTSIVVCDNCKKGGLEKNICITCYVKLNDKCPFCNNPCSENFINNNISALKTIESKKWFNIFDFKLTKCNHSLSPSSVNYGIRTCNNRQFPPFQYCLHHSKLHYNINKHDIEKLVSFAFIFYLRYKNNIKTNKGNFTQTLFIFIHIFIYYNFNLIKTTSDLVVLKDNCLKHLAIINNLNNNVINDFVNYYDTDTNEIRYNSLFFELILN